MNSIIMKIIKKMHILNLVSIFFYIFRIYKIQNNKIVCLNFNGKGYGDSPKYIVEKLIQSNSDYKIVWIVNKSVKNDEFPSCIETVKIYSWKYFYNLSTAKIWINNSRFQLFVKKRKGQVYIQTWHGSLPIKQIEYDAKEKLSEYYKKVIEADNKMIDYLISNSDFCTKLYQRNFGERAKILEYGTPRNDLFFNNLENIKTKVYNYYNIKPNKKILVYAPTFRDNYTNNVYDINLKELKKCLDKNNDDWEIIVRFHPKIISQKEKIIDIENYIDATNYPDMQELIVACDLFITDYSSTMFEAMMVNKTVILYANDIDNYAKERGYYFKFNELPFKLATNNKELLDLIRNEELSLMKEEYENFKEKLGLKESGNASKKVAELIGNIINNNRGEKIK